MLIEQREIGKVIPYANNPRVNDKAISKVAASIAEFGFRQPIVVDEKGVVIAGHTRLKAARVLNMETVPVHVAKDLSQSQARAYRLADNRIGEDSRWLIESLSCELEQLDERLLHLTGFDEFEIKDILGQVESIEPPEKRLDQMEPKTCPECGYVFKD